MSSDITQLLEQWDYRPGDVVVRKIKGKDGSEKIQLRVDLGLLQMNLHGRPDGKRPFGHETYLDHQYAQLEKHRREHSNSEEGFQLTTEDCAKLQQECIQYHHRYICLFQLEEFNNVIRDANRNVEAFDFVRRFAPNEEVAWSLQQFRPQLILMRARARGTMALRENKYDDVSEMIDAATDELRAFYTDNGKTELIESSGEIRSLQNWLEEIQAHRPLSERERLQSALEEAVRQEDYETAARMRDALRNLKAS